MHKYVRNSSVNAQRSGREQIRSMRALPAGLVTVGSRALFERYEPRMLDLLDDRVVRHRRQPR